MRARYSRYFAVIAAGLFGMGLSACSTTPELSSPLPLGLTTAAPAGYTAMCGTTPNQCPESQAPVGLQQAAFVVPSAQTVLNPAQWQLLNTVNRTVNERVRYVTDEDRFGQADVWAPAGTEGDCEDYALTKRQLLWAAGWRTGDLSLAVVDSPSTGTHAVLIANTTQGAFVLDNANSWVMPWKEAGYTWVSAQDADGHWRVAGENAQAVRMAAEIANNPTAGGLRVVSANTALASLPGGAGGEVPDLRAPEPGGR